jgi:cytochrome c-type biogenesis protein CcmH
VSQLALIRAKSTSVADLIVGVVFIGLLVLGSATSVFASIDAKEFSSEENRIVYLDLTRELRCPKCQNQDIADSNAPIAKDMRDQVHLLVEDGRTHEQVVAYMIERFGEFVTYKPRVTTETYLLWYGPWVLIGIGVLVAFLLSQRKNARALNLDKSSQAHDEAKSNESAVNSDDRETKRSKIAELVNKYDD